MKDEELDECEALFKTDRACHAKYGTPATWPSLYAGEKLLAEVRRLKEGMPPEERLSDLEHRPVGVMFSPYTWRMRWDDDEVSLTFATHAELMEWLAKNRLLGQGCGDEPTIIEKVGRRESP